MPETLVLLHGFGGTHRAWDPVLPELDHERYNPLVPDLRGHGTKAGARPISFDDCVADVLAAAPDEFVLCGYSLGGRVAQHVALAAPERVTRLILVATTAGIADDGARAARVAEDERFADELTRMTIEEFADRWMANPLFDGDAAGGRALVARGPAAQRPDRAGRGPARDRRRRDGAALGPDRHADDAGDDRRRRPRRQVRRARRASSRSCCRRPRSTSIDGAGHGLPREAPRELAAMIAGRE